jgi:hypothetical protein
VARRHRSPGAGEEQRPTSSQHEEVAMARDHDTQLAEQIAMQQRRDALLDRILDGLPARDQAEELVFLLGGPFGVDWQTGREPHEAPPPSWEQVVLELGETLAVALEPIWTDDGDDGELPWPP